MEGQRRLGVVSQHVAPDDLHEPVVVCGWRTAFGRGRGRLGGVSVEELTSAVVRQTLRSAQEAVRPEEVDDVIFGKVAGDAGQGHMAVRRACLMAGLPFTVPCMVLNRACSSGLEAMAVAHAKIAAGHARIVLAGGVESMTRDRLGSVAPQQQQQQNDNNNNNNRDAAVAAAAAADPHVAATYWSMGQTSEEVARRYNVTREEQDAAALLSQQRAAAAKQKLRREIVEVAGLQDDEGPRPTTAEGLAKLKPAFGGFSTAGNSSQISDGAGCVLMMTRGEARRRGLPVLGRLVSYAAVGVEPAVMGVGPAEAIPAALAKAQLKVSDISVWEVNEAFASQFVYVCKKLGLPLEAVNKLGGAIALGHPLAATGVRLALTALHQLHDDPQAKYAVVSMCVGGGFGAAAVFAK